MTNIPGTFARPAEQSISLPGQPVLTKSNSGDASESQPASRISVALGPPHVASSSSAASLLASVSGTASERQTTEHISYSSPPSPRYISPSDGNSTATTRSQPGAQQSYHHYLEQSERLHSRNTSQLHSHTGPGSPCGRLTSSYGPKRGSGDDFYISISCRFPDVQTFFHFLVCGSVIGLRAG